MWEWASRPFETSEARQLANTKDEAATASSFSLFCDYEPEKFRQVHLHRAHVRP